MAGVTAVVLAGLAQVGCTTASEELPTSAETTTAETTTSVLPPDSPQTTSEPTEPSKPNESAAPDDLVTVEADGESEPDESATTTPSTTAPVTTTTLERHEQAPHLFDLPGDDLVIVRAGPSVSTEQVTRLQAPIYAIEGTGSVETDDFGTAWRELHVGDGYVSTGWLEADRLEISERTQVSSFDEPCAEAGISEGTVPVNGLLSDATASGAASGAADHIAQMWQFIGPGCDRLHVALGTDWDYGMGGKLASEASENVTAEAFGSWARITVPELMGARFDAALDDTWNLTALVARTVDGEIAIDVYAPAPSEFAVRALSDPARLLIDVIPAEDVSDAATTAVPKLFAASNTIVPFPAPNDGSPAEVTLPLTVRGYSRWFEATGNVQLHFADGSPALGSVTGDGVVNPGINTDWGISATDYISAWGVFEFRIEAVAAPPEDTTNEYRLLISGYRANDTNEDAEFEGVTIPFRLAN